jgi:hypothetical protein
MDDNIRQLWALTKVRLWPEPYRLVSLPHESLPQAAELVSRSIGRFAALVVEPDEASLTIEETLWNSRSAFIPHRAAEGPFRVVTFQINVELDVCGYFLPAVKRLAKAGIPVVPQCAYLKDHLLVHATDAERTVEILARLVRECAGIP